MLLAGVEANDVAVESACDVLGDDGSEEDADVGGETIKLLLLARPLLYEDGGLENLGCDFERRSGLEVK